MSARQKDERKSEQDLKIKYVPILCNAVSVGYAQYYSIVMRTITLHTIHIGARSSLKLKIGSSCSLPTQVR